MEKTKPFEIELPDYSSLSVKINGDLYLTDAGCGCCSSPSPATVDDIYELIDKYEIAINRLYKVITDKDI